jgi:hypothetical protein
MNLLGLDWQHDRDRLLLTRNDDPTRGTEKLAHLSAAEYVDCGHMTGEDFERFFTFSFVRNPWERIVSEYRYRNYFSHRSFRDFVLNKLPPPGFDDKYRHVMPQYDMLHDARGKLLVDFVGRFENLQEDFDTVCAKLGIGDTRLPHINASNKKSRNLKRKVKNFIYFNGESAKRNYTEFFDDETRTAVSSLYRSDIEAFDYRFGG